MGDEVDRRRLKTQLRLVIAIVRTEGRRERKARASIAERSTSIIDEVAIQIRPEEDPELAKLLADARVAVSGLLLDKP
jgi:hypothetical protein